MSRSRGLVEEPRPGADRHARDGGAARPDSSRRSRATSPARASSRGWRRASSPRRAARATGSGCVPASSFPRRATAHGAGRQVLVRAAPREPRMLEPVDPLARGRGARCAPRGPPRRSRALRLPHPLADPGIRHRAHEAGVVLPRPPLVLRRCRSSPKARASWEGAGARAAWGRDPSAPSSSEPGPPARAGEEPPLLAREALPKGEGLVFRFGISPAEIKSEFLAGRLSTRVGPHSGRRRSAEARPEVPPAGYRDSPSLVTYYAAFNLLHGRLRRRSRCVAPSSTAGNNADAPCSASSDASRFRRTGSSLPGCWDTPRSPGRRRRARSPREASASEYTVSKELTEITAAVHPIYFGEYSALRKRAPARAARDGLLRVRVATKTMAEYMDAQSRGLHDVRWWAAGSPISPTPTRSSSPCSIRTVAGSGRHCGTPEIDRLAERGRAEMDPRPRGTRSTGRWRRSSRRTRSSSRSSTSRSTALRAPRWKGLALGFGQPIRPVREPGDPGLGRRKRDPASPLVTCSPSPRQPSRRPSAATPRPSTP